ncbi:MAG: hypothetical protein QQN41_10920 [Nitrosopumilus sp.]
MRKSLILFLPVLASFSSFVGACGLEHEASEQGKNIIGFGFMGGVISTLLIIVLILSVVFFSKNNHKAKGGKK